MKRTLTSIAAAGVVLGSFVPAAFAATTTKAFVAKPSYNNRTVSLGSYNANVKGIAAKDGSVTTEFLPVWYVEQGLKALGYTATWDGNNMILNITTPDGVTADLDNPVIGTGDIAIQINGTMVQSAPHLVAKDPASKVSTTYVPVWYLEQVMKRLNFINTYDGHTWKEVANDFSISGANTLAVGGKDTLSLTSKTQTVDASKVTWNVDGNGAAFVDANGNFTATAAGTYNVTATYEGVTSKATVVVYGQAAGLKLSADNSNLVANGSSTATVTATVVDANGNPVSNFNGTVNFSDTGTQLVDANNNNALTNALNSVTVTNGVATVSVQASKSVGATDTISATSLTATGSSTAVTNNTGAVTGSTTVTQVAQVATSLAVTADKGTVENNVATSDNFTVQVLDQAGKAMLTGTYPVALSISGPGQFSTGTVTSTAYVGNGTTTVSVPGTVMTEQGQSGAIVVTAASTGLTSGTATIKAVTVGTPAALQLATDASSVNSFAAGTASGSVLDINTVDANGNPVADAATYTATVWDGSTQVTSGVTAAVGTDGSGNPIVTVTGTVAGTYTIKVTSSDNLTAATGTVTITPNTASTVAITTPANDVNLPIGSNSTTIKAQLEDQYGNAVKTAGVQVEFTVTTTAGSNTATLGGSTSGKYIATTDANGVVSASFVGSHSLGDTFKVGIDKVGSASASTTPVNIKMTGAVPTSLTVGLKDTLTAAGNNAVYLNSTSYAEAGDTVTMTITAADSYGNVSSNGDTVQVTLPAGLINPVATNGTITPTSTDGVYNVTLPTAGASTGVATITATASAAGSASVAATDLTVGSATLTGTGAIQVVPSFATGAAFFYQGKEVTSSNELAVTANTPVQLTLQPVDSQGNAVIEGSSPAYFTLNDGGFGGAFKAAANNAPETVVTLPAGSQGVSVWYQNAVAGSYDLSASTSSQLATVTHVTAAAASSAPVAGTTDNVTVTLYDANGNVVPFTSANQAISVTSAGNAVTGPSTASFTNGVATVPVTAVTSGAQSFTITVNGVSSNPVSVTTALGAVSAANTTVSAPATVVAGSSNVTVKVTPKDAGGNAIGSGQTVSVSDGTTSVAATWNATNSDYEATFTETTVGSKTFTATVGGTAMTNTAAVTVNPAALATLTVSYSPATLSEAAPGTATPTIVGKDQYGNTVSATGGTYTLTASPVGNTGVVTLDGTTGVLTLAAAGTAADQGTYTVTYTDGAVSNTFNVTVTA